MAIVVQLLRIMGRVARAGGAAAALAVLLSGCSAIKLGYAALPELLYWRVDAHLDLDDDQAPRVRDALARLQRWHRSDELPRYAALLDDAARLAEGGFTPAQACALVPRGRAFLSELATQAEPAIAALALSLSPAQITHLQKHFARRDAEWRKEWLDAPPAELAQRRAKLITDRAETFYGPLDEAQRARVLQAVQQSTWDGVAFFAERQRRQNDAVQTLRAVSSTPGMTHAQAREVVRGWLQRSIETPDGAWRARRDAWADESCRGAAALHASATPAQRDAAVKRLRAYQRDLLDVAAAR